MSILLFAIVCVLIAALWIPREKKETDTLFYFVQMTDPHFGRETVPERMKLLISEINELPMKIEFVAVTGDITNRSVQDPAIVELAKSSMEGLKVPLHLVIGNEDINVGWEKHDHHASLESVEAYKKNFGPLAYKKEYHGVVCLFVCTAPLDQGLEIPGYDPMEWMRQELDEAAGKPVLIFNHWTSAFDYAGQNWPDDKKAEWEELITSANVKGEFTGHYHRSEQHWIGDIPVYVAAPVAGRGFQSTFRIYEYYNGRLTYITRYLDGLPAHLEIPPGGVAKLQIELSPEKMAGRI